jgi:hypothetical protein
MMPQHFSGDSRVEFPDEIPKLPGLMIDRLDCAAKEVNFGVVAIQAVLPIASPVSFELPPGCYPDASNVKIYGHDMGDGPRCGWGRNLVRGEHG